MNRYPMFNPQVLISFVAVCETLSFTRGADRVSLSQSTVSLQVKRLEDLLGCPLLERSSHQVQLTEEGERLLSYARRIIALNEEAHDALTGASRLVTGPEQPRLRMRHRLARLSALVDGWDDDDVHALAEHLRRFAEQAARA